MVDNPYTVATDPSTAAQAPYTAIDKPVYVGAGPKRRVSNRSHKPVIGAYLQRVTWLHTVPAWVKICGLVGLSGAVTLARSPLCSAVALLVGVVVFATLSPTRPVVFGVLLACSIVLPLACYHLLIGNTQMAATSALTFPALIVWATVVSATTTVSQLIRLLERTGTRCGLGKHAERCALAAGIAIRSIPIIHASAQETIEVLRSRSIRPYPWRVLTPASLNVVRSALATGEAITARGLLDAPASSEVSPPS